MSTRRDEDFQKLAELILLCAQTLRQLSGTLSFEDASTRSSTLADALDDIAHETAALPSETKLAN